MIAVSQLQHLVLHTQLYKVLFKVKRLIHSYQEKDTCSGVHTHSRRKWHRHCVSLLVCIKTQGGVCILPDMTRDTKWVVTTGEDFRELLQSFQAASNAYKHSNQNSRTCDLSLILTAICLNPVTNTVLHRMIKKKKKERKKHQCTAQPPLPPTLRWVICRATRFSPAGSWRVFSCRFDCSCLRH